MRGPELAGEGAGSRMIEEEEEGKEEEEGRLPKGGGIYDSEQGPWDHVAKTSSLALFQKNLHGLLLSAFGYHIMELMLVERWSDMMVHNTRRWLHNNGDGLTS